MEYRYCPCTGCAEANTQCGLKAGNGGSTCNNLLRIKGQAFEAGICHSCLCKKCWEHPCTCEPVPTPAEDSGELVEWNSSNAMSAGTASSWQQAGKGKGPASTGKAGASTGWGPPFARSAAAESSWQLAFKGKSATYGGDARDLVEWDPHNARSAGASSSWQPALKGKSAATWTCQHWSSSQQWLGQDAWQMVNPCNKGSMKATKAGVKGPTSTSAADEIFQVIQEMQSRIESLEHEVQDLKDIIYSLQ